MYVPPKEEDLHPICKALRLRNELGQSVHEKKWKRSHNLAKELIDQIDICLIYSKPHLDGLFSIGTMWYQMAPKKAIDMIDRFNQKLKASHRRLAK
jgi:hypothetical protein